MAFLDATLNADGATSETGKLALPGPAGRTMVAGVRRTQGGSTFDVRLQIGIDDDAGARHWFDVLTLDTDGEAKPTIPAVGGQYRFRAETAGAGNTLHCMATV